MPEHRRTLIRACRCAAAVAVTFPLAMCAPAPPVVVSAPSPALRLAEGAAAPAVTRGAAVSDHVVVTSIDGLRPDAIGRFGAHTLGRLAREGSASFQARTILPSKTLPSHTSMLTGVDPATHGITWNENETDVHGVVASPTIFATAHAAGLTTAAFFSKGKFNHLLVPGTLDHGVAPEGDGRWLAGTTVRNVERYLEEGRPNLMFVHIGEPDDAGHVTGWMSPVYAIAVQRADGAVRRVLAAADRAFGEGRYTVIVTADHGGHGLRHGSSDPRDVTIPWIAWGRGVKTGNTLASGIHTVDTAATALWLLGVAENVEGQPVLAAIAAPPPVRAVAAAGGAR
ncbi:MAG TPA: ectonucleotide pyrophosphatase/phosphodiesterase [Longimicrobium sp.]|nr:ectonucleotide pyrophosphatase/phosphodiesterase [Longimicrobium sp.]